MKKGIWDILCKKKALFWSSVVLPEANSDGFPSLDNEEKGVGFKTE